jgi:RHS repeat-associated protein
MHGSSGGSIASISETTGPAWADPVHDRAGNMTTIPKPADMTGTYTGIYDAWDRLVEVKEGSSTIAKYQYDGTSGRIVKVTYSGGSPSETRHYFFSSAWRVLEERVGASTSPDRQYLWGRRYVDELVFRDADTDANGSLDQRLYAVQDGNWNVTAIVDTSGSVVERFAYTPYGERSILTSNWQPTTDSYAWSLGHQGLSHDSETGLLANRYRYLHPLLGRFTTRDPIGYLGGSMGLYEYVVGNPVGLLDPAGLQGGAVAIDWGLVFSNAGSKAASQSGGVPWVEVAIFVMQVAPEIDAQLGLSEGLKDWLAAPYRDPRSHAFQQTLRQLQIGLGQDNQVFAGVIPIDLAAPPKPIALPNVGKVDGDAPASDLCSLKTAEQKLNEADESDEKNPVVTATPEEAEEMADLWLGGRKGNKPMPDRNTHEVKGEYDEATGRAYRYPHRKPGEAGGKLHINLERPGGKNIHVIIGD